MITRPVEWKDSDGCRYVSRLPEYEPDGNARLGLLIGPPDLTALNLPDDIRVRLNHELVDRGLLTIDDMRQHRADLDRALMRALRLSSEALLQVAGLPVTPPEPAAAMPIPPAGQTATEPRPARRTRARKGAN